MTAHPALAIDLFHAAVEYGKVQLEKEKEKRLEQTPSASQALSESDPFSDLEAEWAPRKRVATFPSAASGKTGKPPPSALRKRKQ